MTTRRKHRALRAPVAALAALATVAAAAGIARGAGEIRSSPLCCTYDAPSYNIAAGQVASFANATPGTPHDVAATVKGPDGKALFRSAVIPADRSTPVNGTQYLAPGSYRFFCTIHGPSMSSTLEVGPGTALARPRLSVGVLSGRIARVRDSGKLIVKLADAGSKADGATLKATVGGVLVARKSGIDLAAGAARKLSLPLTARGRKALAGRDRAVVTVTGSVPFGKPDVARRALS